MKSRSSICLPAIMAAVALTAGVAWAQEAKPPAAKSGSLATPDSWYSEKEIAALQTRLVARTANDSPAVPGKAEQMARGRAVYMQICFICHQPKGQGILGQIPPLARSDFLAGQSKEDCIRGILLGRSGEIVVNRITYRAPMLPLNYLTDGQIADVLTYVLNGFGNNCGTVSSEEVARVRRLAPPPPKNPYE